MTRIYLMFLVSIILLASCGKRETVNTNPKASITYYNESGDITSIEHFNRNEDLLSLRTFNADGEVKEAADYKYDSKGLLVEKIDSIKLITYKFSYDNQDRQILEVKESFTGKFPIATSYSKDGLMRVDSIKERDHVTVTMLDERGNELEVVLLDENRDTFGVSMTSYNDDDLEVENKYSDGKNLLRHRVREYNDAGEIIRELWYNPFGELRLTYIFEYDQHMRLIKKARYTGEEEDFRLEYEYKGNERYCSTHIPRVRTKVSKEVYTYHESE